MREVDLSLLPEDITLSQLQRVARAFGLRLDVTMALDEDEPLVITLPESVLDEPVVITPCLPDAHLTSDPARRGRLCPSCGDPLLWVDPKSIEEPEEVLPTPVVSKGFGVTKDALPHDYVLCRNPECNKALEQNPIGRKKLYCDGKCKSRYGVLSGTKKSVPKQPEPVAPVARPTGLCGRCDSPDHHVEDCPKPMGGRAAKKVEEPVEDPSQRSVREAKERLAAQKANRKAAGQERVQVQCARCHEQGHSIFGCTKPQDDPAIKVLGTEEVTDTILAANGNELTERFRRGMNLGYTVHPDVMALYGVDLDLVEGVLREPEQVAVRPESFDKEKRYVVLSFKRGDLEVILGTRNLREPMVIAVYASSRLEADTHRVNHAGGGGKKREGGLPKTPTQMASRLRAMGCEVAIDVRDDTAPVTYKGQDLGRVTCLPDRSTVESDYQRIIRKIDGINRKEMSSV